MWKSIILPGREILVIENKKLNEYEKSWIEKMLSNDFTFRKDIISQINQADIMREYTDYYLCIKFAGTYSVKNCSERTGVPLEMCAYLEGNVPIQFLLHIQKGIVSELEVFRADSSKISRNVDLDNAEIEILIDPEWE